jgi:glycosyltransferase involved in cell wall biosynthesis
MVPFALRQVARQRGARIELVLATHGFTAGQADLDRFRELASHVPVRTVEADGSELFGDVMNRAAAAATGDVLLKMDDDDWYSPDFVTDLLLAREYAGATITGAAPEITFLEPLWLTTRRPWHTEAFAPFVAGGTMMIERSALADLGGFRSTRRYVDANLLSATIDAGGSVYRTHGLNYVLHRGEAGHTWDAGLGYFLRRNRVSEQWRGFRPSALLETDPDDAPSRSAAEEVAP